MNKFIIFRNKFNDNNLLKYYSILDKERKNKIYSIFIYIIIINSDDCSQRENMDNHEDNEL
jgi:hypothetical protein